MPDLPDSVPQTRFTRAVDRRVLAFARKHGVPADGTLVAVSGGPDSTALLLIAARLRAELGLALTAAHFDHMLRSHEEAASDRAFVEALCGRLGVLLATGRGDVSARARRERLSLEDAARRARYAFLAREAKRAGAGAVLLGHTLDDQAETVLLHLLRGSGLDGLAGMRPLSRWPFGRGPQVARPLLALRRADTERYCRECGVTPRRDPTNEMPIATRNRVRHELLPVLRAFNPRVEEALDRLARAAANDTDFVDAAAGKLWPRLAGVEAGRVTFPRKDLAAVPGALLARLVRRAVEHVSGTPGDLEALHVERVVEALGRARSAVSLPNGVTAVVTRTALRIERGRLPAAETFAETVLPVPGTARLGKRTIEARIEAPGDLHPAGPHVAILDAGAIAGPLHVRARRPGDRLRPLGLRGSKKVQDILIDAKVPLEERDAVPIICDDLGIVWIAGHSIDERVAATGGARRLAILTVRG